MALGLALRTRRSFARSDAVAPRRIGTRTLIPWLLPLLLLVLWQLSLSLGIFRAHQLPPPLTVLTTAFEQLRAGVLPQHILATMGRVLAGFLIGSTAALLLGTAVGLLRGVDRAVDPTLQAVRTVPTLAWAPLLLLWLGIDEPPKVRWWRLAPSSRCTSTSSLGCAG